MAEYENFDRQYRLAAGPGGGEGFEVGETSAANPVPLHISFSLQKTDLQEQNTGRVTIWNLNPSQLATLDQKDCALSLKAGYGNRLSLIFAGVVSFVTTTADGADRKTEIEVIDNLVEVRDTYVTVSYNGQRHGELEDHLRRCGLPDGRGHLVLLQCGVRRRGKRL